MDDKEIEINIDDILTDTISIEPIDMSSSVTIPSSWLNTTASYGNVTISAAGSGYSGSLFTTAGANGSSYNTLGPSNTFQVSGDANFEGDVKVKGRSLEKMFQKIEDRLAILQDPDPAKLEKYAALKKAYEHYKTLERLIGED